MSELEQWLVANDAYLGNAVAWVRGRLERLAPAAAAAPVGFWQKMRLDKGADMRAADGADAGQGRLPRPAAMLAAENEATPPALAALAKRLGLSSFERDVLLLCAALEFDSGIADLCARAQRDANRNHPSFGLAMMLFDEPAWDALSPERPLRYWRLLDIKQPQGVPLLAATLSADERIVNYLKGLNYLDDRLSVLLLPAQPAEDTLPPSQQALVQTVVQSIGQAEGAAVLPVIQLLGRDGASKRAIAAQAARALGCHMHVLDGESLPSQSAEVENFARLWQRESLLLPLALYLDTDEMDGGPADEARRIALNRLLSRTGGLMFLATRDPWARLARSAINVEAAKPSAAEQQQAWQALLDEGAVPDSAPHAQDAASLAGHFNLNLANIRQIAANAHGSGLAPLWDSALMHARPALDQLAQRLDPKASWDDLKLPAPEKALLRQVAEQVGCRAAVYDGWGFRARMNRGLGISALFTGDSGTGKTMAAEVIARELKLLIYRIDLSAVVSKFIGETEKNLRKLFDAAEDSGAILFFDEADALFGKRSEVKDSHDRYANIEVNYLLQRMETYRGLAILATNRKSGLDHAFMRRLRFVIGFPFPGPEQRKDIWANVFPPQTPCDALEWERLARFNLSGGSIQNIALNAAFLAVKAGQSVSMPLMLEAVKNELRKLEKPINEADFRWLVAAGGRP